MYNHKITNYWLPIINNQLPDLMLMMLEESERAKKRDSEKARERKKDSMGVAAHDERDDRKIQDEH